VVGTANEENSSFTTSNEMVNRLYSNIIWGQRSNFLSVPTDCPQRDERLGWMGDTQIFSRAAAYIADVYHFSINGQKMCWTANNPMVLILR
jgi:alpha-L-rhamnosidase